MPGPHQATEIVAPWSLFLTVTWTFAHPAVFYGIVDEVGDRVEQEIPVAKHRYPPAARELNARHRAQFGPDPASGREDQEGRRPGG